MTRRPLISAVVAAAVLLSAPIVRASDAPQAAPAPALSAEHAAKLNKLRALPQADPNLTLAVGVGHVAMKPLKTKKEVSCGIYLYPPNPSPAAVSPRLYFVNTTGQPIPSGAHINWEVQGYPSSCCKGEGNTSAAWAPNPPSPAFLQTGAVVIPPQPWTRECKAWVTLP